MTVSYEREVGRYGPLLSPVEAQRYLGISASTVRTWHRRREAGANEGRSYRPTGLYDEGHGSADYPRFLLSDLYVLKAGREIWGEDGRNYTLAEILDVLQVSTELADQPA